MTTGQMDGKGQSNMHSVEFLAVIRADREREIKANQRAQAARREWRETVSEGPESADKDRSIGRIVRPTAQSSRTTTDPSL